MTTASDTLKVRCVGDNVISRRKENSKEPEALTRESGTFELGKQRAEQLIALGRVEKA